MLSLAAKAGKVVSGEFMCEKSVKSKKAFLVIISEDASANTEKKFTDMCSFYKVKCVKYGDSGELGHCIGKAFRKTVAVTDSGFSDTIGKLLDGKER